jgi:hypothetical protein
MQREERRGESEKKHAKSMWCVTEKEIQGFNKIEVGDPYLLSNILLSLIISIEVLYRNRDQAFILC